MNGGSRSAEVPQWMPYNLDSSSAGGMPSRFKELDTRVLKDWICGFRGVCSLCIKELKSKWLANDRLRFLPSFQTGPSPTQPASGQHHICLRHLANRLQKATASVCVGYS